jgi:type I restriction enzyme S subunit
MSDLIPDDWMYGDLAKSGVDILDGDRGKEYPKETDFHNNEYCLFLSAKNVTKSGFKFEHKAFITREKDGKLRNGKLVRNDLVVTTRGTVGNVAFFDKSVPFENIRINSGMAIIRSVSSQVNSIFLNQLLHSFVVKEQLELLTSGSAQPQLTIGTIKDLVIPIPPLPEQQKIATILTSVDEVIEKTQAQIDKLKDLKTAMMQELLTKGIGHVEFKDSPVGRIPVGWDVLTVGTLADVIDPQPDHRTPSEVEGGIPYVGLGDIDKSGIINFSGARKVSQEAFEKQIKGFEIHEQAFIFGKIGTIGNPSILPKERFYCLSANIVLVTTSDLLNMRYLYQLFMSGVIDEQVAMQTNTTSQPALGIKKVREFLVPVPRDEKEKEILVKTLSSVDSKTESIRRKLILLKSTKKALMQDLLTGKVRVPIDE